MNIVDMYRYISYMKDIDSFLLYSARIGRTDILMSCYKYELVSIETLLKGIAYIPDLRLVQEILNRANRDKDSRSILDKYLQIWSDSIRSII